ncbi:hypothetical protein [Amycolatopsis circi]|nr:hypothetical protein [Amycolatopsis circi]
MAWGDRLINRTVERAKDDVAREKTATRQQKTNEANKTEQPKDTPR